VSVAENEKNLAPVSASNTIAVLYFNNKTGLEDLNALQKGMAIMLTTDLAKVEKLQVVERIKVQALLDEMNLGTSGLQDPATPPKIGKMLGAYYISTGDIVIGKMAGLNINPILIDVPFETVTPQTVASGNLQDMFRMEKEILFSIIKQMKIYLTAKQRDELNKPLAAGSGAALAFFAGVDLSDKGRYAEAAKMYEKAVQEDKNFTLAKDALQELKTLGLTASGGAAAASSPNAKEAVEEGSSTGNIGLITLGVVAVGGVAALALSGGGGGSSSSTTPTTTDTTGPVIVASDPADKGDLPGCSGTLHYTSNETLKAKSCAALISSSSKTYGWGAGDVTVDNTKLDVSYTATNQDTCEQPALTMTVTISGCQDTAGNTMTAQGFTYYYTYP
jgi:TolB-like protein